VSEKAPATAPPAAPASAVASGEGKAVPPGTPAAAAPTQDAADAGYEELGRAGRGAAVALIYEGAMRLRGLILLPVLTKCLATAVYGLYVQVMVVVGVGTAVSGLQLQHSLVRFLPGIRAGRERSAMFLTFVALTSACALVLVPAVCLIAVAVNPGLGAVIVPLALLVVVKNFILLFTGYFRATERILAYASFNSVVTLCEVVVIGVSAAAGASLAAILWRAAVLNAVLGAGVAWRIFRELPPSGLLWHRMVGFISFSVPLVVWGISWWVVESSDRLVIGKALGDEWAGYYHPAYVLGALILVAPRLAGTVLPPMAARLHDGGQEERLRFVLSGYWKALIIVGLPFAAGCLVMQGPVLRALTTPEIARYSRGVTPLIAVSMLFLAGAAIFGEVMKLKMRPGYAAAVWVVAAAVSLASNILLVPRIGIIAGALSALVAFGLAFACIYRAASRHLRVSLQPGTVLRCGVACGPMVVGFSIMRPSGLVAALAVAGGGLALYAVLLFALRVVTPHQVGLIWSALRRPRRAGGGS